MKLIKVNPNNINCIDCGKEIQKGDLRCLKCAIIPNFLKKKKSI